MIGKMKKLTKNHIHSAPEKLMVNAHLFEIARRKLATAYELDGESTEQTAPAVNATDPGATKEMGALLGHAKLLPRKKWRRIAAGIREGLKEQVEWPAAWARPGTWSKALVHTYTRALLPGTGHEVTSRSHTRSRSRIGYYVMQNWIRPNGRGGESWERWVADIKYFIRIQHPSNPRLVFRLAIADALDPEEEQDKFYNKHLTRFRMVVVKGAKALHKAFPLQIENIASPVLLMHDKRQQGRGGQLQDIMTFHPLMFSSKRTRVEQYTIRPGA